MNATSLTRHQLDRRELFRLSQPARLQVDQGSLWITLDLEPKDFQVDAGETFDYDGRTPLIASPLGGPAVFTTRPAAAEAPQRGWRTWSGWTHVGRLIGAGA